MEVEEGADLAAEGTRFVLVQSQLQAAGQGELDEEQRRALLRPGAQAPPPGPGPTPKQKFPRRVF